MRKVRRDLWFPFASCSTNHYLFVFDLCNNIKHNIMQNVHQSVPMALRMGEGKGRIHDERCRGLIYSPKGNLKMLLGMALKANPVETEKKTSLTTTMMMMRSLLNSCETKDDDLGNSIWWTMLNEARWNLIRSSQSGCLPAGFLHAAPSPS